MKVDFDLPHLSKEIDKMTRRLSKERDKFQRVSKKTITSVCRKLEEESVKRAPFKEGFLESSHKYKVQDIFGAIEGYVFIPSNSPASDYAIPMHEGHYNLGLDSKRKEASVGVKVGRKFLERAMTENEKAFSLFVAKELKKALS